VIIFESGGYQVETLSGNWLSNWRNK